MVILSLEPKFVDELLANKIGGKGYIMMRSAVSRESRVPEFIIWFSLHLFIT